MHNSLSLHMHADDLQTIWRASLNKIRVPVLQEQQTAEKKTRHWQHLFKAANLPGRCKISFR